MTGSELFFINLLLDSMRKICFRGGFGRGESTPLSVLEEVCPKLIVSLLNLLADVVGRLNKLT